jgi:signal transduction histidine kinase
VRPTRLPPRVGALVPAVATISFGVLAGFGPRWLLLDAETARASFARVAEAWTAATVAATAYTVLRALGHRRMLRALSAPNPEASPVEVLELFSLPARTVRAYLLAFSVALVSTLFEGVRPPDVDPQPFGALVLLALTLISTASLPLYVAARSAVARVLEIVPHGTMRDAIALLDAVPGRAQRVRRRLLSAAAAPVAFVAIGASLLVWAHERAFLLRAREDDAQAMARGTLDLVSGSTAGRLEAMLAAASHGFFADIDRTPPPTLGEPRSEAGRTVLSVPVEDGYATVRFEPAAPSRFTIGYALLAVVAVAVAASAGARLGRSLSEDLTTATRELRGLGAQDVVRGTRMAPASRFAPIRALRDAVGDLGAVFQRFASVQERAIDERGATERMRGFLLASMSHDLKGPLGGVLGFAELALREPLSPAQRESLTIVEQRGRELLALVQTILDAARIEAGQLELGGEWTAAGDVIMGAVAEARDLAGGLDVPVAAEVQPGMPRVWMDGARVTGALAGIVSSAIRFVERGGRVVLRATLPEAADRLRIDVETEGRAKPAQHREELFGALGDPERARKLGSLGLGLWLAKAVIGLHGGGLEAQPGADGGVAFTVWLPVDPPGAKTGTYPAQG